MKTIIKHILFFSLSVSSFTAIASANEEDIVFDKEVLEEKDDSALKTNEDPATIELPNSEVDSDEKSWLPAKWVNPVAVTTGMMALMAIFSIHNALPELKPTNSPIFGWLARFFIMPCSKINCIGREFIETRLSHGGWLYSIAYRVYSSPGYYPGVFTLRDNIHDIFSGIFVAPITEEVYFRELTRWGLKKLSPSILKKLNLERFENTWVDSLARHTLTAALFAYGHVKNSVTLHFFGGLIFAAQREVTGGLIAPIVTHALHNTFVRFKIYSRLGLFAS